MLKRYKFAGLQVLAKMAEITLYRLKIAQHALRIAVVAALNSRNCHKSYISTGTYSSLSSLSARTAQFFNLQE